MSNPKPLAGPPPGDLPIPDIVAAVAAGRRVEPVWVNELGGMTWRVFDAGLYVKWAPASSGLDLAIEAERMLWAWQFASFPKVLDAGRDDGGSWLVTRALDASSAVSAPWMSDPRTAVTAIGIGLRAMHDSLPVADCPWSWSVELRLAALNHRPSDLDGSSPPSRDARCALMDLGTPPDIDELVVCHGDACCPNTLISDNGCFVAHVDLGELGVADRWADLAVATHSTVWNYGAGWEELLLEAYGIDPDPERTRFYRRLWDLT